MQIKEITDKSQWENFIIGQKPDSFLQSWNWGEFNALTGEKIWRLGIFEAENLIGAALIIRVNAKRGRFLFCPQGPIIEKSQIPNPKSQPNHKIQTSKILNTLFVYLKDLARKESADFVRISSLLEDNAENLEIFRRAGFRNAPVHLMHPELSWILDISKSEENLLKGMRKTTRNLIRRAEREKVKIELSQKIEDIDRFYAIHDKTVSRHGFTPFSRKYLEKEMEAFLPDKQISLFFASHNNEILSSAIIIFYGNSVFYHHGASLASKIPGSYLLLWEAIKEAKRRACERFNFWGIAPENKPKHPWMGLTLFKMGFGGEKYAYLHCQDLPLTAKYRFNWAIESFRRWRKGY